MAQPELSPGEVGYVAATIKAVAHTRVGDTVLDAANRAEELLAGLPERQRVAVVLIHGLQWTQQEVADLLGVGRTTVERHLERGMRKLRAGLEVSTDA